jgi:hypothetical protein
MISITQVKLLVKKTADVSIWLTRFAKNYGKDFCNGLTIKFFGKRLSMSCNKNGAKNVGSNACGK